MSDNIPIQSSFLYESKWSHEIDSVFLSTLITLKHAAGCTGTVFPSHFFFEAKLAIENQLGHSFEWYELVDRLHFMDRRYKTFNEIIHLEGTFWNAPTNTVIVVASNWEEALERNPLLGAYYQRGDPAYRQLDELFASDAVKEEREKTVIVLSESFQSVGHVSAGPYTNADGINDYGEVNSNPQTSFARRKLMFDEGGLMDRESTNKKVVRYYVPLPNGKHEIRVEENKSRILPRMLPPKSPTLAYSCASSSPKAVWRMPRKPNI